MRSAVAVEDRLRARYESEIIDEDANATQPISGKMVQPAEDFKEFGDKLSAITARKAPDGTVTRSDLVNATREPAVLQFALNLVHHPTYL